MEACGQLNAISPQDVWNIDTSLLSPADRDPLPILSATFEDANTPATDYVASISKGLAEQLVFPTLEQLDPNTWEASDPSALDDSVGSLATPLHSPCPVEEDLEIWAEVSEDPILQGGGQLYTWETFADPEHEEPASAYLSEAGSGSFDSALAGRARALHTPGIAGVAIQEEPLLQALLSLAKGRATIFFDHSGQDSNFHPTLLDIRIPGHSLESSRGLINVVIQCGNATRRLQAFVARTYRAHSPFPSIVALAKGCEMILSAMESHLTYRVARVRSFPHLSKLLDAPAALLLVLQEVIEDAKKGTSDINAATKVYDRLRTLDMSSIRFGSVFECLFKMASLPCLRRLDASIGLSNDPQEPNSLSQDSVELPGFIEEEMAESIHELEDSLCLLRTHLPGHPLCQALPMPSTKPRLEIDFEWDHINQICLKAELYERNLSAAVLTYGLESQPIRPEHEQFGSMHSETTAYQWQDFAQQIDAAQPCDLPTPDNIGEELLERATHSALSGCPESSDTALNPELTLCTTLSLSPLLSTQNRLVNAAVLRLIMRTHKLRDHLELQYRFHLLGDGAFVTRLTSALFDPSRASTERRKGTMRTNESMGLRLSSRTTWPPASSELQLALMGIVTDCYYAPSVGRSSHRDGVVAAMSRGAHELPGGLSFAIRQLPAEDADRCMDADSLYALDFLRLQYLAPSPINAVITAECLDKYDAIFKALLRILRMIYVVSHLPRCDVGRVPLSLGLEARHFVTTCAAYFFDTGISEAWSDLRMFLDALEKRLDAEDQVGQLSKHANRGLEDMRKAHEQCLNRIMSSLLLRSRHAQAMVLLEEIFNVILGFSKAPTIDTASELRGVFMSKIRAFTDTCQGLMKNDKGGRGSIGRLVFALDTGMSHRRSG